MVGVMCGTIGLALDISTLIHIGMEPEGTSSLTDRLSKLSRHQSTPANVFCKALQPRRPKFEGGRGLRCQRNRVNKHSNCR